MQNDRIKDSGIFMNRDYLKTIIAISIICFLITLIIAILINSNINDSNNLTINGENYTVMKDSVLFFILLDCFFFSATFLFIGLYVYNYYDKTKSFDENRISSETASVVKSNDKNVKYVAFIDRIVKCPECGKEVRDDPKYCPECGKKLREA